MTKAYFVQITQSFAARRREYFRLFPRLEICYPDNRYRTRLVGCAQLLPGGNWGQPRRLLDRIFFFFFLYAAAAM